MRNVLRAAVGVVAVAMASWAIASSAHAHGRPPETGQIVFHPEDGDTILVRTTFGLLITRDGGDSWSWICPEALGASRQEDPSVALMADGSIVAGVLGGLLRSPEGCSWNAPSSQLEAVPIIDQLPELQAGTRSRVLTSKSTGPDHIWRTEDNGQTWSQASARIGADEFIPETLSVAPSDASRIYVSGTSTASTGSIPQAKVFRSTDGGSSWESFEFSLMEGEDRIAILGVDPTDPDHLFMVAKHDPIDAPDTPDRVMRSTDGGETWTLAKELPVVRGLAWTQDGSTVWIGGDEDDAGFWRSENGGDSFERIGDQRISCLTMHEGTLWACGDNFDDGFAVGRSTDGGNNFEPVMTYDEVTGVADCAEGSVTRAMCAPIEEDLYSDLGVEQGMGGGGSGGCRVASTAAQSRSGATVLAVGLALAALLWRRRY